MSAAAAPVALVTGASSGIGLEASLALAAAGHRVVATVRSQPRAEALLARAGEAGVQVEVRELEVTDDASAQACVTGVLADLGAIDVLVNNAGAGHVGTLEQLTLDDLRRNLEVNFLGAARMTRLVLPGMRERGAGRILTVTSVGGIVGQPFNDAYCAAKFATEGLMESLAPVAAAVGVHVAVIEPGAVASAFIDNAAPSLNARAEATDDPYAELFAGYMRRTQATFSLAQPAAEVAEIIVQAATESEPAFRYLTSDMARGFAALKLADPDGSQVIGATSAFLRTEG